MGFTFRKLKKLWLLYLFLLFFAFFMFAISLNVYIESLNQTDIRDENIESHKKSSKNNIIVAQYVGQGNIFGNITKDDYNKNEFNPNPLAGALGKPVDIPAKETFKMQRLFQINKFNLLASDRIPLNRTLPDYRNKECAAKEYNIKELPTTSVIIVFHNEAWSILLRTVWSVINRSPKELIKEILLIDDASDREFLKRDLEEYVKTLPIQTKIYRLMTRQGLVPARLLGAENAQGNVLTFLDAHCECSPGWLEPLLARIKENRKSVVSPVIDVISDNNLGYTRTFENHWGAFNWQLHFRWYVLGNEELSKRKTDVTKPIQSPAMAGGLFSIDRNYFYEMGAYDKEMKIWGGENVEMSFRIWQCGGSIEISPCSHVGHLFRKSSPYTFPGGVNKILNTNLIRAATVWMDEWADFIFMYNPIEDSLRKATNVSERLELRKRLNCKPFSWYLKNVWPNNFFPDYDRFFGKIVLLNDINLLQSYEKLMLSIPQLHPRNRDTPWDMVFKQIKENSDKLFNLLHSKNSNNFCLRTSDNDTVYGAVTPALLPATIGKCSINKKDMFVITSNGQVMTNENICLDTYHKNSDKNNSTIRFFQCFHSSRQYWIYDINTQEIHHKATNLCLTAYNDPLVHDPYKFAIKLDKCEETNLNQKWGFISLPWKH